MFLLNNKTNLFKKKHYLALTIYIYVYTRLNRIHARTKTIAHYWGTRFSSSTAPTDGGENRSLSRFACFFFSSDNLVLPARGWRLSSKLCTLPCMYVYNLIWFVCVWFVLLLFLFLVYFFFVFVFGWSERLQTEMNFNLFIICHKKSSIIKKQTKQSGRWSFSIAIFRFLLWGFFLYCWTK